MIFIYNFVLWIYRITISIASLFHPKAKLWNIGRKDIFEKMKSEISSEDKIIWMHCASLGEFEQGRILLEKTKNEKPEFKILLTFFSPSGYEIRKNYSFADYIFYLPLDSKKNATRFLEIAKPSFVIFVKNEFWYYFLNQLNQKRIPTYLISATFSKNQIFFKFYGSLHRKMLGFFNHVFVQDEGSKTLLLQNNFNHVSIAGDTRIDRVVEIVNQAKSFPLVDAFVGTTDVMVCGSTWKKDENIFIPYINNQKNIRFKFIIAPHEISEHRINSIIQKLSVSYIRYSKANMINVTAAKVLIIDNIGMLSSLYKYGKFAFIGGGYEKGIHNTLEPMAFGLPVFFGKKYYNFEEAKYLVENECGFSIKSTDDLKEKILFLENEKNYNNASTKIKQYISENKGGSKKVFNLIFEKKQ